MDTRPSLQPICALAQTRRSGHSENRALKMFNVVFTDTSTYNQTPWIETCQPSGEIAHAYLWNRNPSFSITILPFLRAHEIEIIQFWIVLEVFDLHNQRCSWSVAFSDIRLIYFALVRLGQAKSDLKDFLKLSFDKTNTIYSFFDPLSGYPFRRWNSEGSILKWGNDHQMTGLPGPLQTIHNKSFLSPMLKFRICIFLFIFQNKMK